MYVCLCTAPDTNLSKDARGVLVMLSRCNLTHCHSRLICEFPFSSAVSHMVLLLGRYLRVCRKFQLHMHP